MARNRIDASWAGFGVARQVQGGCSLGRSVRGRWRGGEARGGRGRGKTEWMGEDGMREVEAEGRRGGKGEEMG